jgi:prepilin-type processing-associated H-X9-DG protein
METRRPETALTFVASKDSSSPDINVLIPARGRGARAFTLSKAKAQAHATACRSNLRQVGLGWELWLGDHDDKFPDRRDLKVALPGGYRPWGSWPPSDPRTGWAALVLSQQVSSIQVWHCPSLAGRRVLDVEQTRQETGTNGPVARYWMWRFDRVEEPVPLDNFWAKRREEALQDLLEADNPNVGRPGGLSEVELGVDVYFPAAAPTVEETVRGFGAHARGKNRLWLDGHVAWDRDSRLR